MKPGSKLIGAAVAALVLCLASADGSAQTTVKVSYNQAATSDAWRRVFQAYADELESLSGGKIKAATYPNGVLHPVGDGFKAILSGITDVTAAYPVYMASSFNIIHANELPRVLPESDIAATRVVNEMYPEYYMKEYERVGVYLAFYAVTPSYDILTKKPVKSLADLKGLKIRAAGGTMTEIVQRLGATPVTMTITDTYAAFQQGVLDGVLLSTADLTAYRLDEIGRYNYRIGVGRVAIPQAIRKDLYDSLDSGLKKVVATAGRHAAMNYAKMYTDLTAKAIESMKSKGIELVQPTEPDIKELNKVLAPMAATFKQKNASATGPSADEVLAKLAELKNKYEGMSDADILRLDEEQPITAAFR